MSDPREFHLIRGEQCVSHSPIESCRADRCSFQLITILGEIILQQRRTETLNDRPSSSVSAKRILKRAEGALSLIILFFFF